MTSTTNPAPAAKIANTLTIIASLRATAARLLAKAGLSSHAGVQEIQDAADILENIAPPAAIEASPAEKCYSLNGEDYNYTDLGEALTTLGDDSVNGLQVDMTYYAGDSRKRAPSFYFSMDSLLENMGEAANDEAGEYADDFPDMSKEKQAELQSIISNWLDRNVEVSFFTVKNPTTVKVTAQDVADFGEPEMVPVAAQAPALQPVGGTPEAEGAHVVHPRDDEQQYRDQLQQDQAAPAEAPCQTGEPAPLTTNPFPQPEPITRR